VHDEYGAPGTSIISALACSLSGKQITLKLGPGSRLARLYGATTPVEHTTCNYGLSPAIQDLASRHGMIVAATDDTGEVRAVERPDHPFFVATLYQPQLSSTAERPHPILTGFVNAIVNT
jgi:CTP synthase (UTP-ammonia lyase)